MSRNVTEHFRGIFSNLRWYLYIIRCISILYVSVCSFYSISQQQNTINEIKNKISFINPRKGLQIPRKVRILGCGLPRELCLNVTKT